MSVRELLMKPGRFDLKLRDDTPKSVLDSISEFDHVVITPTRLLPIEGFPAEYAGHVDALRPPAPTSAVLLLDSRNYDSTSVTIPNTGSAGSGYDLTVNDVGTVPWAEANSAVAHPTWSDWGGEPGDAPMTLICAVSNDPNYDCYARMTITSAGGVSAMGVQLWTTFGTTTGLADFYGEIYDSGIQNYSNDLVRSEWSIYTVEIDPTAGTVKRRIGNTVVAPNGGYVDTFTSGASYLNTKYGTGNGTGWDLEFQSPGDAFMAGKLWRGVGGLAMTRTVLTDADRDAWYDYFFSDADPVLSAAIYTGIVENVTNQRQISGVGLPAHLGREDGRGPILEAAVSNDTGTLTDWVGSLLPSALIPGTITDTGITLSGTLQWTTAREALDYAVRSLGAEWRVNPNGSFDAGAPATLFTTDPTVVVARRSTGVSDGRRGIEVAQAVPTVDVDGYTTRVTVVGKIGPVGEISTGTATQTTGYRDLFGNRVQLARLVNDPKASAASALVVAGDALDQTDEVRRGVTLSSTSYAVPIHVRPGDHVAVYDPEAGLTDSANQINWHGELIAPINLRCKGYTWPIEEGMGVYVRASAERPAYTDLTPWVVMESSPTQWEVGSGLDDPELDPAQLSPAYLGQHAAILDRISAAKAATDRRKAAVIGYTASQTGTSSLATGIGTTEATTNLVSDAIATVAQHVYQITYRFQLRESATAVDTLTARVRRGVGTAGTVVEGPTAITKNCGASGRDTLTVVGTDAPGAQAAQQWTLTLETDTGTVDAYRPYSITIEDVGECIAAGITTTEDESNVISAPIETSAGRRYRIAYNMTVLFGGGVTYLSARVRRGTTTAGTNVYGPTPVSKSSVSADGESKFTIVAFDTPGDQFEQQWVLTLQTTAGLLYVFEDSSVTVEDVGPA